MKAIVIGATGATGKELVRALLNDDRFDQVTALVRKPYFEAHPKLNELIVDFEKLENYKDAIQGDVAFSCLGTTLQDAGSKEAQWKVDHDYQLKFASIARENKVRSFVLLSSIGANPKSSFFYPRMKGVLEQNLQKLFFDQLVIIQPGGIDRPNSTRKGEKLMISTLKAFNSIGLFKSYKPISPDRLAQAMIKVYYQFKEPLKIVSLKEMLQLT